MNSPKKEKVISSPFTAIFGFLASLIATNFIEKASLLIHHQDSIILIIEKTGIIIICGFWFFYIIYGTITWLMYTEYNPKDAGIPPSFSKMLFLRFIEFIPFVWLYDIIHIIDPEKNHTGRPISRLSFDIGIILLLWLFWRLLFLWFQKMESIQVNQEKVLRSSSLSFVFIVIFMFLYFQLGNVSTYLSENTPLSNANLCATIVIFFPTIVYLIVERYYINKNFYQTINKFLKEVITPASTSDH